MNTMKIATAIFAVEMEGHNMNMWFFGYYDRAIGKFVIVAKTRDPHFCNILVERLQTTDRESCTGLNWCCWRDDYLPMNIV